MVNLAKNNEMAEARKAVTKSIRDLLNLKITVPLGNPNLKMVHTNSFINCQIPSDFTTANLEVIATKLNSKDTRYTTYKKNRWYVEAVTITHDGKAPKMELELNPFATNHLDYMDNYHNMVTAYTDAVEKQKTEQEKSQGSSKTSTKSKTVKTAKKTTGSTSMDKAVDKAIKGKTKPLDKAKAIDKAFKTHIIYKLYKDAKKTRKGYKSFESAWKKNHLNCADGANLLCAMFMYAGLNTCIIHVPKGGKSWAGHYIVRVIINGKKYYTDNSANTGNHTTKPFGKVWNGRTKGSVVGTLVKT